MKCLHEFEVATQEARESSQRAWGQHITRKKRKACACLFSMSSASLPPFPLYPTAQCLPRLHSSNDANAHSIPALGSAGWYHLPLADAFLHLSIMVRRPRGICGYCTLFQTVLFLFIYLAGHQHNTCMRRSSSRRISIRPHFCTGS